VKNNTILRGRFVCIFFLVTLFCYAKPPETFQNPVIPGFHPDPSICRVGEDYYLVNSSFEWYPGVPVHHSRDLVNWKLIGYVLDRPEQLQMLEGMEPSRGIWAPTLRYHDGLFYMITTCQSCGGNFYVTATDPAGPWSDPVFLGLEEAPGIDPSIFWDDDGSVWYTGAGNLSGRPVWPNQNGAWMQLLDVEQRKLIGPKVQMTYGHAANARWTEGPHLYKLDGKYQLLVAEGGTGFHHAITAFTADLIHGPYIPNHTNPALTHRHLGLDYRIQAIGHGDIVQTQNGDWWGVTLGVRPIERVNLLGRETFLTPVTIEEGAPVFNPGVGKVLAEDKRPDLPWTPIEQDPQRDEFDEDELRLCWNFLRTPLSEWYELKKGALKINLRPEQVTELVNPSLIARRIQHFDFEAKTQMKFNPKKENEKAGIVTIQNDRYHYCLMRTKSGIELVKRSGDDPQKVVDSAEYNWKSVCLVVRGSGLDLEFFYGPSEDDLKPIGGKQDRRVISTNWAGGFIGPYVGMVATSVGKKSKSSAVYEWFEYTGE
jgi:xylan 1,4-beta-xylosidase